MTLVENILLFLPLCLVICLVASTLGREQAGDILRHGLRLFVTMSLSIMAICVVVYLVMEYALAH